MDKHTRKRVRFEWRENCRRPSDYDESEAIRPAKRICEDSNSRKVDLFSEIMGKMEFPHEETKEDLVWDMMKRLEEVMSNQSCGDEKSYSGYSIESEDEYNSCVDLDYMLDAKNYGLGILSSPQSDNSVQTVNDYYVLFNECILQMERDVEQQLFLRNWLGYNEKEEQDRCGLFSIQDLSDLFSVQDCQMCSTRIGSRFPKS